MIITALIPIKHNSTRVPNKNFRLMNGKPLYTWIINTLLELKYITNIVIDSDSPIIFNDIPKIYSEHVNNNRIILHKRSENLISDNTSTNEIFKNIISELNLESDYYFQTHVTNPLLKVETINNAIELFLLNSHNYESLFSVKKIYARLYTKDGKDLNHDRKILIPTQNLDPIYEENSCIYIFTKKSLFENNARISDNALLFPMNNIESMDIDWPEDFMITEILMKREMSVKN